MSELENSIIEGLPQIPYIIDQVGAALKWAKEELKEAEYEELLRVVINVANYTKEVSEPNFYKTHLIIASILSALKNPKENKKFEVFNTASKAVEKTLDAITVDSKLTNERGCFKSILLTLAPLAKKNEDYFALMLIGVKHNLQEILKGMKAADVKEPITSKDYVIVLGYANVMANLRMANLKLLDRVYKIFNDIEIILNNEFNY